MDPGDKHRDDKRRRGLTNESQTRAQEAPGQFRAAQPGELSQARRRILRRARRGRPWGAAVHLSGVLRPRAAAGACAHQGRHQARRHRGDPRRQHAGDARGALRRADDRGDAQPHQYPPRCAPRRLLPRARRGQAAAGRSRVSCLDRSGAGKARRQTPHRRRHRRCRDGRRAELRQHRVRGFHCLRRSGLRLSGPRGRVGQHLPALHVRHHRQSQGRGLQPPRRLPRRACQRAHLQARPREPLPVDPAHVPLLGLDLHLGGHRGRRHPRLPAQGRAEAHLRRHRRASRDAYVRRAHRPQHARACARRHPAAAARAHQGGDRRRGPAGHRHRAHGGHGLRGAAPLRHDGELRALDLLRADVGVAGPAGRRALPEDGAPGAAQSAHRADDGGRRRRRSKPCRGTGRPSASSCWPATR